jgi:F-type H+-transporting ATPase subunit epsilon
MTLHVRVIAPDQVVWDQQAQEVILPSGTGQLGILTDHAPLLTTLDIGVMRVRPGKEWLNIAVMGGFAEVDNNEIKVLVNSAQLASDIDPQQARKEYDEAQKAIEEATAKDDRPRKVRAIQALRKARARLQAVGALEK